MSNHSLQTLIGRVYEAAVDRDRWQDVLREAASEFDAAASAILVHDLASGRFHHFAVHPDYPCDAAHEYAAHYAAIDPIRAKSESMPALRTFTDADIAPIDRLSRLEVYSDFYTKWGWGRFAAAFLRRTTTEDVGLVFHRPHNRPVTARDVERICALVPHAARAIEIDRHLERANEESALTADALEALACPAMFVDDHRRVLMANTAAAKLLGDADGLVVCGGQLTAQVPYDAVQLQRVIATALATPPAGDQCIVRRRKGAPLTLIAAATEGGTLRRRAALLIVAGEDASSCRLKSAFAHEGLTEAEARVAAELCRGQSPRHIAQTLGISVHTVRTHLKKIQSRLGVRGQPQIVAELLRGPGFIPRRRE